jgi:hypothetical protein
VKIHTNHRKDGYNEFTLSWREGGRRRLRSLARMDEARLVAGRITVRLANAVPVGDEATKRDLEMLRHCESLAGRFGVTLAAAIEEWAGARQVAGDIPLSDAVRFYQTNRADQPDQHSGAARPIFRLLRRAWRSLGCHRRRADTRQ